MTTDAFTRARFHGHGGFTLIELLVGMVLLAIIMSVAFRPIMDAFRGSAKSQTQAISEQQIQDAEDAVNADLRIATAGERTPEHLPGVPELQRALTSRPGTAISARTGQVLEDVYDLWYAGNDGTKSWIVVRADVAPQAGIECVQYAATLDPGDGGLPPKISLTRTVSSWSFVDNDAAASCAGTQIDTKEIIPPAQTVVGTNISSIFTLHKVGSGPTCAPVDVAVKPGVKLDPFAANGSGIDLNRVVAISVDLYASRQRGGQFSNAHSSANISLRAREDVMYRRALGCT